MPDTEQVTTVICPVYNEENYIRQVLEHFVNVRPERKELYIIDGNSTDRTAEIVKEWVNKYSNIHLLNNPDKYVPYALNIGITQSKGDPVIRLDAHTVYAEDYYLLVLETFEKTGADIVGGPMRAIGRTSFQKAVAHCTSTKFGVGDSSFHNENAEGYVDSVYLGAWKREIFDDVGLFDVQMKRNQDDEFHYRAKSKGKKIYLNPEIKSWYYPRSTFKSLFKQYYEYGLYKPLVIKKVASEVKVRHLVPSVFTLYIILLPLLFFFIHSLAFIFLFIYLLLDIWFSLKAGNSFFEKMYSLWIYPALHVAYGSGFIIGCMKFLFVKAER